jgi:hypothetical protein
VVQRTARPLPRAVNRAPFTVYPMVFPSDGMLLS